MSAKILPFIPKPNLEVKPPVESFMNSIERDAEGLGPLESVLKEKMSELTTEKLREMFEEEDD